MLLHQIAITLVPEIGNISAKKLIAYCGGVEEVFKTSKKDLGRIPGITSRMIHSILNQDVFTKAEDEIKYIEKNRIKTYFYLDKDYPNRLKNCDDSPIMLYFKGEVEFNIPKTIAIVGTRAPSDYGRSICEKIIHDLSEQNIMVVSGLAFGIDAVAHKAALQNGLQTVGVLGHGLDILYPAENRKLAQQIIEQGGLLTEFLPKTKPDRQNFPMRNRIVAGMVDCVLVVESGQKGGSLITANLAIDYNRDVLAIPGRVNDELSQGCNMLIKNQKAQLVQSAADILYTMGWEERKTKKTPQRQLFVELTENEKHLLSFLSDGELHGIDFLSIDSGFSMSITSATLLGLEFKGIVKSLPGKQYKVI